MSSLHKSPQYMYRHRSVRRKPDESADEQSTDNSFAAELFAGRPLCGSCGERLTGDIYWTQAGPTHLSCINLSR